MIFWYFKMYIFLRMYYLLYGMKRLIYVYILYLIVFAPVIFYASQFIWLMIFTNSYAIQFTVTVNKDQWYYLLYLIPVLSIPYIINDNEQIKFNNYLNSEH